MSAVRPISRHAAAALLLASLATPGPAGTPLPKDAARAAAQAQKALGKRDADRAVEAAERAVRFAPRDAETRVLLGRAYLAAGRFTSAETSFGDALTLDPGHVGAGMSLALCQIALGKWDTAHGTLEGLKGKALEADRGLALALAGDREGAIDALEAAARAPGADAKTRQNLALVYALDGRWSQARSTAAQDLAGPELDQRMREWAVFSQPHSAWDQVSMLLNVTPVKDPGTPASLALSAPAAPVAPDAPAPTVTAAADAAPAAPDPVIEAVPPAIAAPGGMHAPASLFAQAKPAPASAPVADAAPAPAPEPVTQVATTIPAKDPAPLIAAPVKPAKVSLLRADAPPAWYKPSFKGRFVVQLGAFAKEGNVQAAWSRTAGKLGQLATFVPSGASYALRGATLHRLVLSGFETRDAAAKVCGAVKAKGGDCFVRAAANEQPLEWAMKKTGGTTKTAAKKADGATKLASR